MLSRGSNPKKKKKKPKKEKRKKEKFKASLSCLQNEKKTWLGLSQPVKKRGRTQGTQLYLELPWQAGGRKGSVCWNKRGNLLLRALTRTRSFLSYTWSFRAQKRVHEPSGRKSQDIGHGASDTRKTTIVNDRETSKCCFAWHNCGGAQGGYNDVF